MSTQRVSSSNISLSTLDNNFEKNIEGADRYLNSKNFIRLNPEENIIWYIYIYTLNEWVVIELWSFSYICLALLLLLCLADSKSLYLCHISLLKFWSSFISLFHLKQKWYFWASHIFYDLRVYNLPNYTYFKNNLLPPHTQKRPYKAIFLEVTVYPCCQWSW